MTMKATLIISVYKHVEFLKAILHSLRQQTEQDIEVIISEDGEDAQMKEFVDSYPRYWPILHLTQPDNGWNKEKALNRAVLAAKTDWLIFIDGDCVLHPKFIEMHIKYQQRGVILAGKRIKLNEQLTQKVLNNQSIHLLPYLFNHKKCRYVEEAFFCPLAHWIRIPVKHLLGSNMSMSRTDLLEINGFDENYTLPATGEDYDIEWRLQAKGCKIISLRHLAVQYHLYHKENWNNHIENMIYCRKKQAENQIICKNGIHK